MAPRDIYIDGGGRIGGGLSGIKKKPADWTYQPNDVVPKGTTGVFTTGGKPMTQTDAMKSGMTVAGEQKVTKGGKVYTYRNGVLVGVSEGKQDVDRRNIQAGINQARADDAAQQPDLSGADLSTGGGAPKGVQSATDALLAQLTGGQYGQQYNPAIEALKSQLGLDQTALTSGSYLNPITALQGQLGTLYDQAKSNVGLANTALVNYLAANMTNPYANVQAQQAVTAPQFAELLGLQGVSAEPLQAEAALQAQTAGDTAAQFQNLLGVMGALQGAGLSSRQAEATMADTFAKQMLEANKAGYGQQLLGMGEGLRQDLADRITKGAVDVATLEGQKATAKETLQGQLIDLLTKGGTASKGLLQKAFGGDGDVTGKPSSKAAAVKDAPKNYDSFKEAVKAMHPNFKGSTADAKKKFPKLAAAFKK